MKAKNKNNRHAASKGTLRTKIWIRSILIAYKISLQDFKVKYYEHREKSKLVDEWYNGKRVVSEQTVYKIDRNMYPSSRAVYDLDVFELLEDNITKSQLQKIIKKNTLSIGKIILWNFPSPLNPYGNKEASLDFDNPIRLFERGDIYGFLGILILLRKAEIENNHDDYFMLVKDAYRALPGFCRNEFFINHWEEFYYTLQDNIQIHSHSVSRLIRGRMNVIKEQIFSEKHITCEELRPRTKDGKIIELELPYEEAWFH